VLAGDEKLRHGPNNNFTHSVPVNVGPEYDCQCWCNEHGARYATG